MRVKDIVLSASILIVLGGCYIGPATYEVFKKNNDISIGKSFIPLMNSKFREIYDENRYIYIVRSNPEGCVYGFLTNRDDKPEVVQEWIILSGKEHCKHRQEWVFSF
ncbi:hypothetical protein KDE13_03125 [Campylobacter sp. faydin G-140]|uniref:hypothetical protein n=1 Tax=Campylobacter anatolicus TaxID=2829105 RepID=UPI001B97EFB2|nr:hypothetical protein [Campylobacter anatolicus]MBR8465356.1 hypothetical protein [Campylobacter anatolicus]